MSEIIVVSNDYDPRISMGFMRAAIAIVSAYKMDSGEVNQKTLRINKYLYQILGSLLEGGRAVNSSIQKRIKTALDNDPLFDSEFDPELFQECFSATQEALKDICVESGPI